jgi:hypothetical protein
VTQQASELDLIWGAQAIADAIGRTRRQTFYLLETGQLPAKKLAQGGWVASRKKLREYFEIDTVAPAEDRG